MSKFPALSWAQRVHYMKNTGSQNPMNSSGTQCTMTLFSLEELMIAGKIEDYTEDGWVRVASEWIPFSHYKKINGDLK